MADAPYWEKLINKGKDAQYIYLKGTARDSDSSIITTINCEISVNGETNLISQRGRGLNLVTLNRQTLNVVESINYDTYAQAIGTQGATGITDLVNKLDALSNEVFVCLVSFDAIGWSPALISRLQNYGMSDLPYTDTGRYPFLFIGYKGLDKGDGLMRMRNIGRYSEYVELGVYVANGSLSSRDGERNVVYSLEPSITQFNTNTSRTKIQNCTISAYKTVGDVKNPFECYIMVEPIGGQGTTIIDYGSSYTINTNTYDDTTGYKITMWNTHPSAQGSYRITYITIPIVFDGKIGRFFYYAGVFDRFNNTNTFDINDAQAPFFEHTVSGQKRYHVFNPDENPQGGSMTMYKMWKASGGGDWQQGSWNNAPWEVMTNDFKYLITEAIFAQFAHFGSAIISGDWMISQYGTINGIESQSYQNFDPEHPNDNAGTNFIPYYAVDMLKGKTYQNDAEIRGTIKADSLFTNVCFAQPIQQNSPQCNYTNRWLTLVNKQLWDNDAPTDAPELYAKIGSKDSGYLLNADIFNVSWSDMYVLENLGWERNIGNSNKAFALPFNSNVGTTTIQLPPPSYFKNKTIEIINMAQTANSKLIIGCDDGLVHSGVDGCIAYSPYINVTSGGTLDFSYPSISETKEFTVPKRKITLLSTFDSSNAIWVWWVLEVSETSDM